MAKVGKPPSSNEPGTYADAVHERISRRAYELYERRGRVDGFDAQDWLQAEREIVGQAETPIPPPARKTRAAARRMPDEERE